MNVTSLHLYSNGASVAQFSLDRADHTQSYIIQAADGLDANELIPQFYAIGATNRPKFYNLNLPARLVTLKIKLNPQYASSQTPSSLRDALYKAISSYRNSTVELRFYDGVTHVASLTGFVTKFDAPLFSYNPEVTLTIRCDFPYLRSPSPISLTTASINKTTPVIVDNVSTAPHGFKFNLTFTATVSNFTINTLNDSEWLFRITQTFLTNDQLYFSSQEDDRYLYMIRSGVTTHLVDKLNVGVVWPLIFPGSNSLAISSGSYNWGSFSYYNTFWGV